MPGGSKPRSPRKVGFLLFEGFELLDVFGPAEIFGVLEKFYTVELIGFETGSIASAQGPSVIASRALADCSGFDLLLVPGGIGTRHEVDNVAFLHALNEISKSIELVGSVCTGSGLLAKAGILDGLSATTNKLSFQWVVEQSEQVDWQKKARWVEDGKCWTSSGVTAGIDMALAIVASHHGRDFAKRVADAVEHDWHEDASWDPFADLYEWTRA